MAPGDESVDVRSVLLFCVSDPFRIRGTYDAMAIDALISPLLKIDLFQGLRPLQISEIARRAERIVFQPGQVIVECDQPGEAAFVIVSGSTSRTKGPDIGAVPEPIRVGSLVGEMAMLVDTEYSSTVVANSMVRAMRITRASMYEQMAEDAALAEHLVGKIAFRLKDLAAELRRIDSALASTSTLPGTRATSSLIQYGAETRH